MSIRLLRGIVDMNKSLHISRCVADFLFWVWNVLTRYGRCENVYILNALELRFCDVTTVGI